MRFVSLRRPPLAQFDGLRATHVVTGNTTIERKYAALAGDGRVVPPRICQLGDRSDLTYNQSRAWRIEVPAGYNYETKVKNW